MRGGGVGGGVGAAELKPKLVGELNWLGFVNYPNELKWQKSKYLGAFFLAWIFFGQWEGWPKQFKSYLKIMTRFFVNCLQNASIQSKNIC